MRQLYILQDRKAVPTQNLEGWKAWMKQSSKLGGRLVAYSRINESVSISTFFCPIHVQTTVESEPKLFELRIRGGRFDGRIKRVSTYEQAEFEHEATAQLLRGYVKPVVELFPIGLG